jgi:hypothetical protein
VKWEGLLVSEFGARYASKKQKCSEERFIKEWNVEKLKIPSHRQSTKLKLRVGSLTPGTPAGLTHQITGGSCPAIGMELACRHFVYRIHMCTVPIE